jgi:hypothetical protein
LNYDVLQIPGVNDFLQHTGPFAQEAFSDVGNALLHTLGVEGSEGGSTVQPSGTGTLGSESQNEQQPVAPLDVDPDTVPVASTRRQSVARLPPAVLKLGPCKVTVVYVNLCFVF